jgi:hypothetical protein
MSEVRSEILEQYKTQQQIIDEYERIVKEGKQRRTRKRAACVYEYLSAWCVYVKQTDYYYCSM